jgi:hypothetical protein
LDLFAEESEHRQKIDRIRRLFSLNKSHALRVISSLSLVSVQPNLIY